jgi:pyruvyltransferase
MKKEEKPIKLFWWDERKFLHKKKENYGDMLSHYLVKKISGKSVKFVHPKKQSWWKLNKKHYVAIGSILAHATKESIVWGSGIIDRTHSIAKADFRAVRGPETRKYLLATGHNCPEVYGDPALLMPKYYNPEIEKKVDLAIIPHYKDFDEISRIYGGVGNVAIIDIMSMDAEKTTDEILKCYRIISSSLHGVIVAHAYGIPALWVKFSDAPFGDDVKFKDYYTSVGIHNYESPFFDPNLDKTDLLNLFEKFQSLPDPEVIKKIQENLIKNCPF